MFEQRQMQPFYELQDVTDAGFPGVTDGFVHRSLPQAGTEPVPACAEIAIK
jgi:hypothetical protein